MKKITWIVLFALVVAAVSFLTVRVKTDEKISLQSVPMKEMKVVARAIDFIEKNYVDPQAVNAGKMLTEATKELVRSIPPLQVKEKPKEITLSMGEKKLALSLSSPVSLDELPTVLSRVLGFLDLFYKGRLDEDERLTLAMTGVTDTLDPHSNYLSPKVYNEFKIGTKGNFGGLGIVIGIREGDLSVIAPLDGTPADKAGIKAKDKIVQIGGESTINMGLTEAVEKLRGPVGSKVSLVITREGISDPLKFTLIRALIHIQSVGGRLLDDKRFGLVKIKNFQEDTVDQFRKTLKEFESGGNRIQGLILDLRNNPGGLLDQAVALSDFFLSQGTIVKTVGASGEPLEIEKAQPGDGGEEIPLVVIVNENSASASEIVAGALQFNDRAVVIGIRSFGKGSVQTVYDLKDGSALKLTIAKYLTAKDYAVQSKGINPDVGLLPATIPAKLTDDKGKLTRRIDLFEDVKRRELDLEEMHDGDDDEHKDPNLPPPPVQMTYLAPDKDRDADGDDDDDSAGKIDLTGDFPVVMAQRLLELSIGLGQYMAPDQAISRPKVAGALPPVLDELKKGEDEKIRAALENLSVDWSTGAKEGKPSGVVTTVLLGEDGDPAKPVEGLSAGNSGFLSVTVENKGSAPFYRLAVNTKSDDPLFSNLEFPLGKIAPGEKRTWKTPLKIPDFVHRRRVPVELVFHEAYDRLPEAAPLMLQVEEPEAPSFQYSYKVIDNGSEGTKGNGNGKVEKGETIALALTVKNNGKGESKAPIVNLKKTEGEETFIEKGRDELKPIPAGGAAQTVLKFRVPETLKGKLSFDLNIHDTHLGEDLNDRLDFTAGGNPPPQGVLLSSPVIDLSWKDLPLTVKGTTYSVKGTSTDDASVGNVFIFVGEDKVFFQAPETPSKTLNFDTTVPLKKGANLITLASQDDRELTSRKQWIVWREK
ncbi:MAG TPA: MXAN_5808 family serine peptidase [bacterium]|nr:MXAN_5808 family serine peptidase [bacterium]